MVKNKIYYTKRELYTKFLNNEITKTTIDKFLIFYNAQELQEMNKKFNEIESELYRMTEFSWGGNASNSLDKQIVEFVKHTYKYNEINSKIDNEIFDNTKRYTFNSWYNHWSTILTEYIFKSHKNVISAVGKIKSVDFFIKDIPIDLKITFFPKEFLKLERKNYGYENELSMLKKMARKLNISFSSDASEEILKYQLTNQIKDRNDMDLNQSLEMLQNQNKLIINSTKANPAKLIKWLYENQGEMRFGSENRLFFILTDSNNLSNSWKLKRNFTLQKSIIHEYLDYFEAKRFFQNCIVFTFKGLAYKTYADILFVEAED